MRKIIKSIVTVFILGVTAFSCDYLDVSKELAENLTIEETFNNVDYTRRWHANVFNVICRYDEMGNSVGNSDAGSFHGAWNIMCGDITGKSGVREVMVSGFNTKSALLQRLPTMYIGIRQAMIFLKNGKPLGTELDRGGYISESEMNRMKAECKYFIAYAYQMMFELYGPVSIRYDLADSNEKDLDLPRASVDEMSDYIDGLYKDIIESGHLPETIFTGTGTGVERYYLNEMVRPTKASAMALRARMAVFVASPLFNGKYAEALSLVDSNGKRLFPDHNPAKWQTAKLRLEEFLEFADSRGFKLYYADPDPVTGLVDPHKSVYELTQIYNDEIIWATAANNFNDMDSNMEPRTSPRDLSGAYGQVGVTQGVVDDFFMSNGLAIGDAGSGYREDGFVSVFNPKSSTGRTDNNIFNMYANREPRFYASVTYQGQSWHIQPPANSNFTVGYAKGEGNDNSKDDNSRTGYLLYKFKNRTIMSKNYSGYPTKWGRPNILLRLADFYLYYAEVCNEINPNDPNVIIYLDKVRKRAGIAGYQELATAGLKNIIGDKELQAKAIRQERRVELLCEGQRYFDIHRWMICGPGEEADQTVMRGMNMNGYSNLGLSDANTYFKRVDVEKRIWDKAMYLYPIHQDEIQKSKLLVQNPLW